MSECDHNCASCSENCNERDLSEKPHRLSSIKRTIAIASGKGGVGKSLVTSLLAILLRQKGYQTAILDADITGPSIPKIFGMKDKVHGNQEGLFPNVSKTGIKVISSNMMLKNETDPVAWRGPLIAGLVKQFWTDVIWQDVDFMFVDMPPGTGDVPLTVFQSMRVDGIIIVTSPQELVSMIVSKAVKMAEMMNIPVLGIIENMSYYECGACGQRVQLFGDSHVHQVAKTYHLDVLAQLPIDPKIANLCDQGALEDIEIQHLKKALDKLEALPVYTYNIALPIENGAINPHFGKSKQFVIYHCVKDMVLSQTTIELEKTGHDEVVETLVANKVSIVIADHIGEAALEGLLQAKMIVVTDAKGNPREAVDQYLSKKLQPTQTNNCSCDDCDEQETCTEGCDGCHHH